AACVDERDFAFAILWLVLPQNQDDSGSGCIVEKVVGQEYYSINIVVLDKPFPNISLLILILAAAAACHRTGVKNDGGAAGVLHRCERMLEPRPIRFACRHTALFLKPIERIVFVSTRVEGLVPHRISDHNIETLEAFSSIAKLRVSH